MNILDIILLLIILICGVVGGLRKGFIYQVVMLVALIGGTYMAYRFGSEAARMLSEHFHVSANVMNIIAFVIVFLGVYLLLYILQFVLRKIVSVLLGGWVDKTAGVLLSTLKVVLILGIFIMLWDSLNTTFGFVKQDKMNQSTIYLWIKDFTNIVFPYLRTMISKA